MTWHPAIRNIDVDRIIDSHCFYAFHHDTITGKINVFFQPFNTTTVDIME